MGGVSSIFFSDDLEISISGEELKADS